MTSEVLTSNAALVGSMYDAFKKGDVPFIVSNIADNGKWHVMGEPLIPWAGTYTGQEAAEFFKKMDADIEFTRFDVNGIHEISEDEVVSLGYMEVKGRKSGKTIGSSWIMHVKIKDGKVVYFQDFVDTALASTVL